MTHAELTPGCERFQSELSAHLYGELAGEASSALERHLEICAPCRDELAALRETRKLLDRWETPAATDDPRQIARSVAAQAELERAPCAPAPSWTRWPRWPRWQRPAARVLGAAAALLFALSLFGAEAEVENGRMRLSFGLPGLRAHDRASSEISALEPQLRAIAAEEVAAHAADMADSQEQLVQRYSMMTREELLQELLRLSQSVDLALAENQRAVNTRLASMKREAEVNDLAQRQAITSLASYIRPANNTNR